MTDFDALTPCGECCVGCPKKASGFCAGCLESGGNCREWQESGGCPIFYCTERHGVPFCGLCEEFPCEWLPKKVSWNPHILTEQTALATEYRKRYG